MVKRALATPDAAEIEPQHREIPMHESVVELIDDLMVHRAPELRVGVQHDADRSVFLAGRVITAFDAPGGAGEDDLGHERSNLDIAPAPPTRSKQTGRKHCLKHA